MQLTASRQGLKNRSDYSRCPLSWGICSTTPSECLELQTVSNLNLVAQSIKNLPPMQKTLVLSLGLEDPLEKEMTIHSSALAWEILWTEDPGGL